MAISALVITLSGAPGPARAAVEQLGADPRLELGDAVGSRVAAVLETPSAAADRDALEWLQGLPGVLQVEIASVYFDTALTPGCGTEEGRA